MANWILKILEHPEEMLSVEDLQRRVWPGSETDIVPAHMLLAAARNGGLVIGAFEGPDGAPGDVDDEDQRRQLAAELPLVGFVFGFPGLYFTPDGPRPQHYSHMLGVHPDFRDRNIGFRLKRAQWQMVRKQGVDRITWTFDPLLSRNANLNIARLGAVCNQYHRDVYGQMRDELNLGLPSDRLVVDWWVNTKRVERRLSSRPRLQLDLAHFLAAGAKIVNPSSVGENALPRPGAVVDIENENGVISQKQDQEDKLLLLEIPADFQALRAQDAELAMGWRRHMRELFEDLFEQGYLVTDFIHLPGSTARSFYLLSHGESTL
jgi:predicted GNAT superfamily acetyltransferase